METLKGVWLFNESIDFPADSNPYPDIGGNVYFVTPGFPYNGSTMEGGPEAYVTMRIYAYGKIEYIHRFWDGWEWMHYTYEQYNASKGWLSNNSRQIIFLYEQEVDDNFYNWFIANAEDITDYVTQVDYRGRRWCALADGEGVSFSCANEIMMSDITVIAPKTEPTIAPTVADSTTPILKGVWRFKDKIDATQTVQSSVCCKFISFDNGIYDYVSNIYVYADDDGLRYINYDIKCTDGGTIGDRVYPTNSGGWGDERNRNLYFPSECIVSQEFYDWFIANAEDITDYVTYIKMGDEIIGILRSGMTARLPCKGQVMPSNIRVIARKVSEIASTAGLYDANDNLVASWDTLVNAYAMDVEKNYNPSDYSTYINIPYYVLTNNTELATGVKLVIDSTVERIGNCAFYGCSNLTNITIPDSVTYIGSSAFEDCAQLTSIVIPDGITSILSGMFSGCSSLTDIVIPDSVTDVGAAAFYGCSSLKSIDIPSPDRITVLSDQAFYRCSSLKSIVIPDGMTGIGDHAFAGCFGVTSVTIPVSVTSIYAYAFYNCISITDVYYGGTEEQWSQISISTNNEPLASATIHYNYVPASAE